MSDDELIELEDRVGERRQEVEARLARLRQAIGRETGISPQRRGWLLALLAASAGLAVALRLGKRRSRRRRLSPPRDA